MPTGIINGCKVCNHMDIDEINEEIAAGRSMRVLAARFKLSMSSLDRHKHKCLISALSPQGLAVISLKDVVSIPLQMRERQELINTLIDALIEPMTRGGRFSGIRYVQINPLVALLKIQQSDEQTILKITGVLNEEGVRGDAVMTRQYADLRLDIERQLQLLAGGDDVTADEARRVLAEQLIPMSEIDPTYIDYPIED